VKFTRVTFQIAVGEYAVERFVLDISLRA